MLFRSAFTDKSSQAPVRVAVRDVDGDKVVDQIFAAQGTDGKTRKVNRFKADGRLIDAIVEQTTEGGVYHFVIRRA